MLIQSKSVQQSLVSICLLMGWHGAAWKTTKCHQEPTSFTLPTYLANFRSDLESFDRGQSSERDRCTISQHSPQTPRWVSPKNLVMPFSPDHHPRSPPPCPPTSYPLLISSQKPPPHLLWPKPTWWGAGALNTWLTRFHQRASYRKKFQRPASSLAKTDCSTYMNTSNHS